jgi:hypothetical protein
MSRDDLGMSLGRALRPLTGEDPVNDLDTRPNHPEKADTLPAQPEKSASRPGDRRRSGTTLTKQQERQQ